MLPWCDDSGGNGDVGKFSVSAVNVFFARAVSVQSFSKRYTNGVCVCDLLQLSMGFFLRRQVDYEDDKLLFTQNLSTHKKKEFQIHTIISTEIVRNFEENPCVTNEKH